MQIKINSDRLQAELDELATFSEVAAPAVTRLVYSPEDGRARAWIRERCSDAGLAMREDAVGNMFARWGEQDAMAVVTGSHIDAIPNAGRFDGTLGVLGGLEAIRALKESGFVPVRPIELILFTSEEPTRFGIGCLGSRMMSGALDEEQANGLMDAEGRSLEELRGQAGFTGALSDVRLQAGRYAGFVELHIEQGCLLEASQTQVGLVTSIAAPASMRVIVEGESGHAGAVLMPKRRDALTAAAEIILAVEQVATGTGALDTVGTTGICTVFPGAVNCIPSRVTLAIDVRDTNRIRRNAVVQEIRDRAAAIAEKRNVGVQVQVLNADDPAHCDPAILDAIRKACVEENIGFMEMVSRAYHDTLFMARVTPAAMLFIPCRGGISHRPDEFASAADIATGTMILARTLAALAS